jgi:hypothetical protein
LQNSFFGPQVFNANLIESLLDFEFHSSIFDFLLLVSASRMQQRRTEEMSGLVLFPSYSKERAAKLIFWLVFELRKNSTALQAKSPILTSIATKLAFEELTTISSFLLIHQTFQTITMNHQQFDNYRQQFRDPRSFYRAPEEQNQQPRNGMKRSRGYSPPAFDYAGDPSYSHKAAKRLRRSSGTDATVVTSNNYFNNNNHHGGFFHNKSDDEVSLAEEAQTTPTALPHHSSFMQHKQNNHYQQPPQIHQQQQLSHTGHHQAAAASASATNGPLENRSPRDSGATFATDYQPMNSLLGNLHLARQRQQQQRKMQTSLQTSQEQALTRDHAAMVPQQQQQQPQNHYHRHYGNCHSVPTTTPNTIASGTIRSRKKTVSLRVNSNLF